MRGEVLHRLSFGEGVGSGGEAFPGRLGISAPWRLVFRDVAQSGSAPEWGSGGRGFKSRRPDWSKQMRVSGLRWLAFFLLGSSPPFRPPFHENSERIHLRRAAIR